MHVRMQDSANVEINNPMYLKEEYDYEASEALNGSVSQDIDDVCIKICITSYFQLLPVLYFINYLKKFYRARKS